MNLKTNNILFLFILLSTIIGLACSGEPMGSGGKTTTNADGTIILSGSGASFPKPIYEKWASEYGKKNPNIKIDYQSTGSGAGQKAILSKTADFGASDEPMKDEDLPKGDNEILHIPTVLGAVVMTYNLPGVKEPLKLAPETIADIYLGKIKKWSEEAIKKDNPNVDLPDSAIVPVYRSDASGTSAVFTDFLSKTSADWKNKVGTNKQPSWITGVGLGAPRNDGVMGQVKQNENTIGYVELTYAEANKLPTALVKNKAGNFVAPSVESVTASAADALKDTPDDLRTTITDTDGANAYPISSYTYILVYKNQQDATKGKALVDFLWWAIHDGEAMARELSYAPLPEEIVKKVEGKINSITSGGKPLHQ